LQKGICQPHDYNFSQRKIGNIYRWFVPIWFKKHGYWLEYSKDDDSTFCLCCYLYKPNMRNQASGDYFVGMGFNNWTNKKKIRDSCWRS
jgi:hypothetical protein